jgi:hypothetical protein
MNSSATLYFQLCSILVRVGGHNVLNKRQVDPLGKAPVAPYLYRMIDENPITNTRKPRNDLNSARPPRLERLSERQRFSEETIRALAELGRVLEPIYKRMIAEGYAIRDGILYRGDPPHV